MIAVIGLTIILGFIIAGTIINNRDKDYKVLGWDGKCSIPWLLGACVNIKKALKLCNKDCFKLITILNIKTGKEIRINFNDVKKEEIVFKKFRTNLGIRTVKAIINSWKPIITPYISIINVFRKLFCSDI
jgi:hypothetical protein